MVSTPPTERMPRQIPFIIANEACERFSFYGMRNILTAFLIQYLLVSQVPDLAERTALGKSYFHLFAGLVYLMPLAGGYLADRFFGKYRVILWVSLIYCLGHLLLALFDDYAPGFYAGLFLIAVGSGGIKPCVSAMVGDQFTEKNKALVQKVFATFYWSINFGSFFASLLIPKTLALYGPKVAFGIPGVLMFIATFVFWLGRKHYIDLPPTGADPHSFGKVVWSAVRNRSRPGSHWLDRAGTDHPAAAVENAKAVFRVLAIFSVIPVFWMLFDQKASTWVVQATAMDPNLGPVKFEPSQMQLVNPLLVMLLIPFTTKILYPFLERIGWTPTALRRMPMGFVIGALAYAAAGAINVAVLSGQRLSILWQIGPYILLTVAEILVSTTGLEFAYSQAPRAMKATIQSFFNLTVTVANWTVALIAALNVFTGSGQFFFWAVLSLAAGAVLARIARGFQVMDHFQTEPSAAPSPSSGAKPRAVAS